MVARKKSLCDVHERALTISGALSRFHREMYQPEAVVVHPKKVIRLLTKAKVRFVVMGAHGVGGWSPRARSTQDVDVLVAKKDHARAVRIMREAFPKFPVEDSAVVTRFKDPVTEEPRIDLMKPTQNVFRMVFRYTHRVGDSHRIPDLEMALISKFSAMVSPHRDPFRKMQDAVDFAEIARHNLKSLDRRKLERMAEQIYRGGRLEIRKLIDDIEAGRTIQV
jgi:hypothetical protein